MNSGVKRVLGERLGAAGGRLLERVERRQVVASR